MSNRINYKETGKRVKHYRELSGLTQTYLGDKLACSKDYVCRVELGKKRASLDWYATIADIFGVNLFDILVTTEDTKR